MTFQWSSLVATVTLIKNLTDNSVRNLHLSKYSYVLFYIKRRPAIVMVFRKAETVTIYAKTIHMDHHDIAGKTT